MSIKKINATKIKKWLKQHKILSCILVLGIILVGYFGVRYIKTKTVKNTYVLSSVVKGTFVSTVSGTGQISAYDQLDLKAKASGDLASIKVSEGQKVIKGSVIAQINCPDVYANLQNARLNLAKLQQSDPLSTLQIQNALTGAQETAAKAETDLNQAYKDGYDVVANASLNIPSIITNLGNVFYSSTGYLSDQNYGRTDTAKSYIHIAAVDYDTAKNQYDRNFIQYKNLNRDSSQQDIENLINDFYDNILVLDRSIKEAKNATDYLVYNQSVTDVQASATATQTNLTTWLTQIENNLQALETIKNTLTNTRNSLNNANRTIEEKTQSLQNGTSSLDLQSEQLSLEQAQRNYNDCFVTAPFDGQIAKISAKISHPVNSGDVIATLVTENQIATITLNEIDVTKIKVGQSVDLTFDAIDGLTLKGTISQVDSLGTVDQGVVSYTVMIVLNTKDERVKSGMSVNATITTESKVDVILVPNAAIKTGLGNRRYVEISDDLEAKNSKSKLITTMVIPKSQSIEVGSTNDTVTEITSGLNEGDLVVIKTTSTKANSLNTNGFIPTASTRNFTGAGTGMMIPR